MRTYLVTIKRAGDTTFDARISAYSAQNAAAQAYQMGKFQGRQLAFVTAAISGRYSGTYLVVTTMKPAVVVKRATERYV